MSRFAEGVTGHGRFDVLVAGQAFERDRLVEGEQPEDVPVRSVAGWRRWPQVTRPAEAVGACRGFGGHLALGDALAGRVEIEQHPVHEVTLDRGVRVVDQQDEPGGAGGSMRRRLIAPLGTAAW